MGPSTPEEVSNASEYGERDDYPVPTIPNFLAYGVLAVSALAAAAGMFVLPPLRDAGLSFVQSMVLVGALETASAIGIVAAVPNLYFTHEE